MNVSAGDASPLSTHLTLLWHLLFSQRQRFPRIRGTALGLWVLALTSVAGLARSETNEVIGEPNQLILDLSRCRVTGLSTNLISRVAIDPALDRGIAEDESGSGAVSFSFYDLSDGGETHARLLQIISPVRVGLNPTEPTAAYYFVAPPGTHDFTLIGISDYGVTEPLAADSPFLRALVRAVMTPEKITADELTLITQSNAWAPPMSGSIFQRSFIPALTRHLIQASARGAFDARAQAPSWPFFGNLYLFRTSFGIDQLELPSAELQGIAVELKNDWRSLNRDAQLMFLHTFLSGDEEVLNVVGAIALDCLHDFQQGSVYESDFVYLLQFIPPLLDHLALNHSLRDELMHSFLREIPKRIPALYSTELSLKLLRLVKDGILFNTPEFESEATALVNAIIPFCEIPQRAAIFAEFPSYASKEKLELLESVLPAFLQQRNSDHDLYQLAFALPFLTGPLSTLNRESFEATLASFPYAGRPLSDLVALGMNLTRPVLDNITAATRRLILQQLSTALLSRFPERTPGEEFDPIFDNIVQFLVRAIRIQPPGDGSADDLILPLLAKYNPMDPNEGEAEFGVRKAQLDTLWKEDRVFVCDLNGGLKHRPEFIPVLFDYAARHPGWIEFVVLQQQEGRARGYPGRVRISWVTSQSPESFALTLLHEGGHSLQLRDQAGDPLLKELPEYWYRQTTSTLSQEPVSAYALNNPLEFWAEHTRFWHADTRRSLENALQRFVRGEDAQLNLFIYIWNLSSPQTSPPALQQPLFKLNEAGLLDQELITAHWSRGGLRDGAFAFTFTNTNHVVVYRDYRIRELWVNGGLLKSLDPAAPIFQLTAQTVGTSLVLRPDGLEAGSRYAVEVSTDLVHWTELSPDSDVAERPVEVQASEPTRFFRLRVETL